MEHMMRAGIVVVADIGGLTQGVREACLKFIPGDPNSLLFACWRSQKNSSAIGKLPLAAARRRALEKFALLAMVDRPCLFVPKPVKMRAVFSRQEENVDSQQKSLV